MSENPRSSAVYVPTKPTCFRIVTTTFVWCCFLKSIAIDPIVPAGPLKQQRVFTPISFRTVGWSTLIFLSYDSFLTLLPLHRDLCLQFNSIRIAAHSEIQPLRHGQIHVSKQFPHLRGILNKRPAERNAKREFCAVQY